MGIDLTTPETFPPATPKPCSDCPWRRLAAERGHLGPYTAEDWIQIAHGESAISCHQTIKDTRLNGDGELVGDWNHPAMRQCGGAARFRANTGKSPRNPSIADGPVDKEEVFRSNAEFLAYHRAETKMFCGVCGRRVSLVVRDGRPPFWRHASNQPPGPTHKIWPLPEGDHRIAVPGLVR